MHPDSEVDAVATETSTTFVNMAKSAQERDSHPACEEHFMVRLDSFGDVEARKAMDGPGVVDRVLAQGVPRPGCVPRPVLLTTSAFTP